MKKITGIVCIIALMASLLSGFASASSAPSVRSQAAIVIDYNTGEILFEKDAHSLRSPASMTKVLTAFIAYEEIAAGRLRLDTSIRVSDNARRQSASTAATGGLGGSTITMDPGDHTVDRLVQLMMLPSSNGACIAIAEHISGSEAEFVKLMNSTAKNLGLEANYVNVHGASMSGHNTITTHSMAKLVHTFIQRHPDILRISAMSSMTYGDPAARAQTNRLVRNYGDGMFYQGADGFKTGTMPEAGACLSTTAIRNGRRLIIVTMNAPNVDNLRYSDTRALLDFGFAEMEKRDAVKEPTHQAFRDIPISHPSIKAIDWAYSNRIFAGINGQFVPDGALTRGCFALILWRLEGCPQWKWNGPGFSDIDPSIVHYSALRWAQDVGIIGGINGMALPNEQLPRYQMTTMLYRYHTHKGRTALISGNILDRFPDRSLLPSNNDIAAMQWAVSNGIIGGMNGRILPNEIANREMGATVLYRYNNLIFR